jgi:hypothetical protein
MAPVAPATPATQRSFGEAGTDILAAGLGGLGGLLQFPGQVVGLLPGLRKPGELAQRPGEFIAEVGENLKSEGLKAREALRSKALSDAEKDGVLSQFATAITSTLKDPALITTFVAEQVPQLLGPATAVKLTQKIGAKTIESAGAGLTGAAAEQAVKEAVKTVNKRAAAAAYGTGASMQAADVGDDTYRDAYQKALDSGLSEQEAADRAIAAARIAGTGAGVTALLAQRLPGAQAIEKRLAGVPGTKGRVASGFGEAIGESIEEGGGQVFKNIGLRQVDPNQALLEGVGGAAGLGALGGGILGTALGKRTVEQEQRFEGQREGETDRQFAARLQREIDAGLRPPAPPPAAPPAPTLPTDQQLFTLAAQPNGYGLLENLKQRVLQDQQFPEADRKAAADNIANLQRKMVEEEATRAQTPGSVVTQAELRQAGITSTDPIASIVNRDFLANNQVFDTINQALSGEITDAQRKKYEGLYEGLSQLRQDFYPEGQDAGIPQMFTLPTAPVEEKAPTEEVAAAPAAPKGPTERQQRIEFGKGIGAVQPYPGTLAGRVNLPAQKAAKAGDFKGVIDALKKSKNAVVAEIARRAKDLKTKIAIDDEAVETYQTRSPVMDQFSSDSAKMHLGLLEKLREFAPTVDALPDGAALPQDVLNATTNVFEGGEDRGKSLPIKQAAYIDNSMFAPLGLGEGAKFETKEDFKRLFDAFERVTNELGETKLRMTAQATINAIGAAGVYDAGRDTIFVPEYSAKDEKTLAHEIVHAQTVEAIANPTDEQKPAVQRLEKLYAHVKKVLEERASQDEFFRKPYGIESVQEFVAEGLGNPDFQYTLSRIEYENTTAWDRFTKTIANLLGLKPDNAFTELLQIYSDITTPAKIAPEERVKRIRGPMPPKMPTKAQELPQPKAPVEEGVAEAEKTIKAAERARRTAERQSPSLFTALRGKLTKTEVSDVGANSLRFRPLISKGKGDSISTFVANGDLDPWLPPDKRLGAPNYDEYDNTEFIKEQLRQGNFLTQEANVQIKAAFEGIQQAESLIREYLTPKEVEALINEAQDEQRRIDQAAKRTAAERPPGTAETEDVGDAGLDLGPEFEAQPLGERVVRKSLAAIPEARFKELERRVKQAEQRADEAEKAVEQAEEAKPEVPPEIQKKIEILKQVLRKNLNKFGLKDVELNLERGMTDEGSYDGMLIKLALDAADPLGILRHESVHALKEAGFFTDKQWATLEKMADTKWIDQYLKGQRTVYNGQEMSRYEGYMQEYGGNMAMIREEAIADAFRNFSKKQPAGLMGTLTTRMKNFFKAVKSAFNGQGFESAEDIFGKVEEGALKPTKPAEAAAERKSMRVPDGIPQRLWELHEKSRKADAEQIGEGEARGIAPGALKRNATMAARRLMQETRAFTRGDEQAANDLQVRMNTISGIREAVANQDDRALEIYQVSAPEIYEQEVGRRKLSLRAPETEAFKRWFGDSKIVDRNGEPKVMYHGLAKDTTDFTRKTERGAPIFLTDDPAFAERFAAESYAGIAAPSAGPHIMPLFVRAENPFDYQNLRHIYRLKEEVSLEDDIWDSIRRGDWEAIESSEVQDAIQMAGFDAFYVKEGGRKNLAVYQPNQVKSATGNIGTFEPTSPDIRKSLRTEAAGFTPERIDSLINEYGYTDGRSYGFAAFVNPKEFVNATTSSKKDARRIYDEAGKLDVEALRSQRQTPFLYVDMKTGRIDEHEGRHRMAAMDVEGITSAPVVIVARENKGKKPAEYQPIGSMLLSGQKFGEEGTGDFISVSDLTPLVYTQEEELKKKFANPERLRFSMRSMPTYDPDIDDRIDKVIPKRPKEGFIDGLINFFSPDTFTLLREEFINRYNEAAELDKRVAAQIKAAGGPEQLADERAESAALMSDQSTAVAAAAMGMHNRKGGIPVYADGVVTVDTSGDNEGIVSIFAPLASTGNPDTFRHYQFWANVNRGKRYMLNPGKTRYVERTLEPGDIERAEKRRLEYLAMGIDFLDIQARWRKYNDGLVKLGRDTGVISSRAARDFMEHGDYFPFYRQLNEEDVAGPKTFSTIASVKPPKAAKGSEAEYADFFETVVRNTQAMVTASMKNVAAQRMTAQALRINEVVRLSDNPQIKQVSADTWDVFDGDYIDTVPGATKAVAESAARARFGANVNVVESPTNPGQWNVFRPVKIGQVFASNAKDAMEEARTQHLRRPDIYVYKVLENGTPVYYRAYDLKFINAIKAMNMADLPFIGLLAAPANALRTLVTKEPGYMLVNQMRDSLSAYVTSGVKMTPIVDSARQFAASISKETPEMEALFNAGVIGGYEYAHGVKEGAAVFEREVRKKAGIKTTLEQLATPATSLWGALERGTQISDGATRAEVYKRVLAETGNRAEALWQAAEVLNFYRHGRSPIIRVLTAAIPFMNARIQGLDVLYRAGINPMLDKNATDAQRQRMKTFWTRGMTMMALSSMYWMLVHDDEEYKKQEQETRDNYWLIPGMGLKIAIPFEVGVIFKVLPERILQNAFGSDTGKDTLESLKRQLQSTLGFNFIPQAFLPLYETQTNFSFFTQRPIIGQGMEDVAARYQVSPGTSMFAQMLADTLRVETSEDSSEFTKALAKSLDLSPIKVDHVIKGYTGTIGQYAVEVFDAMYNLNADVPKPSKRFEQLPVIKRLALDPDARGQVTGFFDLKNAVDEVVRTSNLLERTAQTEDYSKYLMNNMNVLAQKDYVLALDKSMKEFREMKTMIQYSNMSADVKRDLILDIQRMENQLTTNIQEVRKLAAK